MSAAVFYIRGDWAAIGAFKIGFSFVTHDYASKIWAAYQYQWSHCNNVKWATASTTSLDQKSLVCIDIQTCRIGPSMCEVPIELSTGHLLQLYKLNNVIIELRDFKFTVRL